MTGENPMVRFETSHGDFTVEVDEESAPISSKNFLRYVDEGFFDGTIFHRVIPGFMIQCGGFTADMEHKAGHEPIRNEADNGLKNLRGSLAMARTNDLHSATSQFFVNLVDNDFLESPHRQFRLRGLRPRRRRHRRHRQDRQGEDGPPPRPRRRARPRRSHQRRRGARAPPEAPPPMKRSLPARIARWVTTAILAAAVGSIVVVAAFRWLPVPMTAFMIEEQLANRGAEPALAQRHDWVPWSQISRHAAIAVIAAEDQKFLAHDGFDFEQIEKAVNDAQRGRRLRGASTISQQVAKNLFLWSGQSWIRKGLEVWFTVWIEFLWPKERILEVYLNSAQFGRGVWGVQAASRHYFGKDAARLSSRRSRASRRRSAEPDPISRVNPSAYMRERQAWILGQMQRLSAAGMLQDLK